MSGEVTTESNDNVRTGAMHAEHRHGAPQARTGRTSPWATASLLCSVAMCCPPVSAIGILLGLRALIQIKADPSMRGHGMAIAGIVIGSLAMLLWAGGAVWWHFNARLPMMHGPREELRAGLTGNIARFKAGFHGPGAVAPDTEAAAFLGELSSRYGRFIDSSQSPFSTTTAPMAGPAEYPIAYTLRFERADVEAEALFITFGQARVLPEPVFKWGWIKILDAERGDLAYPSP